MVHPTRAIIKSQESLGLQAAARDAGEEWVAGEEAPEVLIASAFAFLALKMDDPEYQVPKSYWEAIQRLDLWVPAMEAELRVMDTKEVWDIVNVEDVPEGKKVVDCMWVFANKFDAEGNVAKRKA